MAGVQIILEYWGNCGISLSVLATCCSRVNKPEELLSDVPIHFVSDWSAVRG